MTTHAIGHASTIAAPARRDSAWRWRSLSIRAKLPIGAVLLVTLASAAITAAAYVRVRAFVVATTLYAKFLLSALLVRLSRSEAAEAGAAASARPTGC